MTWILTWPENVLCKSCRSLTDLSNTVCRLSLRCLVFEIWRGGGEKAPPRPESNLSEPARNRVKLVRPRPYIPRIPTQWLIITVSWHAMLLGNWSKAPLWVSCPHNTLCRITSHLSKLVLCNLTHRCLVISRLLNQTTSVSSVSTEANYVWQNIRMELSWKLW